MNIVVAGLTAAGKTTHALLLAKRLGYDYVSASELLLAQLGFQLDQNNMIWINQGKAIEERRDVKPIDEAVNALLYEAIRERKNTVFDSWSLPWLINNEPCVRLWIESDIASRSLKVRVSQEPNGAFKSIAECRSLAEEKDRSTAVRLKNLLGTDIRYDRSVFDVVLDNSDLIHEPTIAAARSGISRFHSELCSAIGALMPWEGGMTA